MRLRQICLVAQTLNPVAEMIETLLGLGSAHHDPNVGVFGLENAVWPVGGNFLEVVAPTEENTAAGRYLERRGGDGGYMVILQCGDAYAARQHIASLGIRIVWEIDRPNYVATHFHPRDVGNTILSVDSTDAGDNYQEEMTSWSPAGPDWQANVRTDRTVALTGAEMQCENPNAIAALWSKLLVLPIRKSFDGHPELILENGRIRFVPALDSRGAGLSGIELKVSDPKAVLSAAEENNLLVREDHVVLCGTRFYLH
jgi:hypothetical protein